MANLTGTPGNDVLTGTDAADAIDAGAGADLAYGGGGADVIHGGDGDDQLYGAYNNNSLSPAGATADGADILYGEGGSDVLRGGAGADQLYGGDGDDNLRGDAGNDTLDGGLGSDAAAYRFDDLGLAAGVTFDASSVGTAATTTLADGQGGTDTLVSIERVVLTGTAFADTLTGSLGDDQVNGADGNDRIEGGAGDDVLYHYAGSATINGGAGDDLIIVSPLSYAAGQVTTGTETVDGGSGSNQLTLNWSGLGSDATVTVNGTSVTATNSGGGASVNAVNIHTLRLLGGTGVDTINSGAGADDLNGGAGNDVIHGGAGDDIIGGGRGDDRLFGDDGFDRYDIETGASPFVGQTINATGLNVVGDNVVVTDGFGGRDTLSGFEGVSIRGGYGDDALTGGAGADLLDGSWGADTINGGAGDDIVLQSAEGTTFPFNGAAQLIFTEGDDKLDGGAGVDTLSYAGVRGALTLDASAGIATGATIGRDTFAGFESYIGGRGNDTLIGSAAAETLAGGAGADTLTGGAGADTFVFGVGDSTAGAMDTITDFQSGVDRLDLTATNPGTTTLVRSGNSTIVYSQGATGPQTQITVNGTIQESDLLLGASVGVDILGKDGVNDVLTGTPGPDHLFGFSGSDTLNGAGGDDQLFGDVGADILTGGAGADRFAYRGFADSNATDGFDIITDFVSGTDKLDFYYLNGVQSVALVRSGDGTIVFVSTTGGQVQVGLTGAAQGTDLINPFGSAPSFGYDLVGSAANETLTGGSGNDKLYGLAGADTLNGGAGDDQLFGDNGADALFGGAGADSFSYRNFADSNATSGYDIIADFVSGTDKLDFYYLNGIQSIALVRSGAGTIVFANTTTGQVQVGLTTVAQGADIVNGFGLPAAFGYDFVGTAADETFNGSAGNDRLYGLAGNDVLSGGGGDDVLYGDAGADQITGGAGADLFAYRAVTDSVSGGFDRILDFQVGIDKLDLRGVHTSSADKYGIAVSGADTLVFFDQGGDGTNDMVISIAGVTTLTTGDVLF